MSQPATDGLYRQRLSALDRANTIRTERARTKRDLTAGRVRVSRLLLEPPPHMRTMAIADLLLAVPGLGRTKRNRLLNAVGLSPRKQLGELTLRQRRLVLEALATRHRAAWRRAELHANDPNERSTSAQTR